jgi:hypothetical protein
MFKQKHRYGDAVRLFVSMGIDSANQTVEVGSAAVTKRSKHVSLPNIT